MLLSCACQCEKLHRTCARRSARDGRQANLRLDAGDVGRGENETRLQPALHQGSHARGDDGQHQVSSQLELARQIAD